jgi:hypothetical protein
MNQVRPNQNSYCKLIPSFWVAGHPCMSVLQLCHVCFILSCDVCRVYGYVGDVESWFSGATSLPPWYVTQYFDFKRSITFFLLCDRRGRYDDCCRGQNEAAILQERCSWKACAGWRTGTCGLGDRMLLICLYDISSAT